MGGAGGGAGVCAGAVFLTALRESALAAKHRACPTAALTRRKFSPPPPRLKSRVASRFPDAGLLGVAREIVSLTRDTARESKALEAPIWWLRILIGALILGGAALFAFVGTIFSLNTLTQDAVRSVQNVEAAINTTVLAALGITALVRLEARIKRMRVTRNLHGLRSVIHVIDMHQLTKDPAALSANYRATAASPSRTFTAPELARYLDYCSEMLSVTGKLAALYAQAVNDDGVAEAVNDIENLGSNLSRKIWQKIMLIESQTKSADLKVRAKRS